MQQIRATSTKTAGWFSHVNLFLMNPAGVIFPSRIGLSEMRAFYFPVGETFHSSFSILTAGKDPHSNAAIYARPTDGAVANFGG